MACATQFSITNAGTSIANGTYTPNEYGGYQNTETTAFLSLQMDGPNKYWRLGASGGVTLYVSSLIVGDLCPNEATWVVGSNGFVTGTGVANAPTVVAVEVPSAPTFGLPADVVALITSRFGTVANFLRLRNQGQI